MYSESVISQIVPLNPRRFTSTYSFMISNSIMPYCHLTYERVLKE